MGLILLRLRIQIHFINIRSFTGHFYQNNQLSNKKITFFKAFETTLFLMVPAFRTIMFLSAVKMRVGLIYDDEGKDPEAKSEFSSGTA